MRSVPRVSRAEVPAGARVRLAVVVVPARVRRVRGAIRGAVRGEAKRRERRALGRVRDVARLRTPVNNFE